jgi:hypothetical protein
MKQEDIEDLKQLIEFLKEHQVAEFEVDRGDLKVRLKFNQPEGSSTAWRPWPDSWLLPPSAVSPTAFLPRLRRSLRPTLTPVCTWSSRPSSARFTARLPPAPRPLFRSASTC